MPQNLQSSGSPTVPLNAAASRRAQRRGNKPGAAIPGPQAQPAAGPNIAQQIKAAHQQQAAPPAPAAQNIHGQPVPGVGQGIPVAGGGSPTPSPSPTPGQHGPKGWGAHSAPGRNWNANTPGKVATVYHVGKPSGWAPSPGQNFLLGLGLIVLNILTQSSGASLLARFWNAPLSQAQVKNNKEKYGVFTTGGWWTVLGEMVFVIVLSFISGLGQTAARGVFLFFVAMYMVWLVFNGKKLATLPLISKGQLNVSLVSGTDNHVNNTLNNTPTGQQAPTGTEGPQRGVQ